MTGPRAWRRRRPSRAARRAAKVAVLGFVVAVGLMFAGVGFAPGAGYPGAPATTAVTGGTR